MPRNEPAFLFLSVDPCMSFMYKILQIICNQWHWSRGISDGHALLPITCCSNPIDFNAAFKLRGDDSIGLLDGWPQVTNKNPKTLLSLWHCPSLVHLYKPLCDWNFPRVFLLFLLFGIGQKITTLPPLICLKIHVSFGAEDSWMLAKDITILRQNGKTWKLGFCEFPRTRTKNLLETDKKKNQKSLKHTQ